MALAVLGVANDNRSNTKDGFEYIRKAFDLRERASEREKYYISSHYYGEVTRQLDKNIEILEQWIQSYPRDSVPRDNLSLIEKIAGQLDKSLANASEATKIDPKDPYSYQNLSAAYLSLNRYDEAKAVADQAIAQKAEAWPLHPMLYSIAFLRSDQAGMQQELKQAVGKPSEGVLIFISAQGLCAKGKLKAAKESYARAVDVSQARGLKEYGALILAGEATCEAEAGFPQEARQSMNAALAVSEDFNSRAAAAILFARIGDNARSAKMAEDLHKEFPVDTLLNQEQLPTVRAIGSLQRNQPAEAVAALDSAKPYELGTGGFGAIALRGDAFLHLHDGAKAALEYQKILDHRGVNAMSMFIPLAHLGLGRAYALQGDGAKAKIAYQDFFAEWKDADPDIPLLKTAKAEYEKLK
jgi:tetratricopeptide (TPR) repeat protein